MRKNGRYTYISDNFCIPVTKAEPLEDIRFIINDFINKRITFCVDGTDDLWEIWRHVEEEDNDKIKKDGMPVKPRYLYVEGSLTEDYDISGE